MKEIILVVVVSTLFAVAGGFIKWLFFSKKKIKQYVKDDFDPNSSYLLIVFTSLAVILIGKLIIYLIPKF